MNLRELVEKICAKEGWTSTASTDGWEIIIPQPKGRRQAVMAASFKDGTEGMVRYTSVVVVFPASMCAMMPKLRILSRVTP